MEFSFDTEDIRNIKEAILQGGKIWENSILNDLKRRIKDYCLVRQKQVCCYCRRPLNGEFRMVIDIEHILPKSKFEKHMFNLINLAASCKRCNMPMKHEDASFFIGEKDKIETHFMKENYKIIHPNLDNYYLHLKYLVKIVNDSRIIKYNILNSSEKGAFTYEFFKLNSLEVDSFNEAQGINEKSLIIV